MPTIIARPHKHHVSAIFGVAILMYLAAPVLPVGDLVIDGTQEYGLDLPRINVLFRRELGGPPLEAWIDDWWGSGGEYAFVPLMAFLDTGASGMVISRESADILGIQAEPDAVYADVGVAGWQFFEVSELLYMAHCAHNNPAAGNPDAYGPDLGPWRLQMTLYDNPLMGALDIWGIPLMAGQVAVLDPTGLDTLMDYFHAEILPADSPHIPPIDFEVKLRYTDFLFLGHPENVEPLPTVGYNPVIDDIVIRYGDAESTGAWLLDTGAMVSMISPQQAARLGLTDLDGTPIVTPDFTAPLGGVGGTLEAPGFQIDELVIPTINGFNIVYANARLIVLEIGTIDERTGEGIILDGIFGTNLLAASMSLESDGGSAVGPYNRIVIDTVRAVMGFDLKNEFALPAMCGDENHPYPIGDVNRDCIVGYADWIEVQAYMGTTDCNEVLGNCGNADINADGHVDAADAAIVLANWHEESFPHQCGDAGHPWLPADVNRDCRIDAEDIFWIVDKWLRSDCGPMNWHCGGADVTRDGVVTLADFAAVAGYWLICTWPEACYASWPEAPGI